MPQVRKDGRIRWQSALLCVCFVGMMLAYCLPGGFGSSLRMEIGLACLAGLGYCMISIGIRLVYFRCAGCGKRLKNKARQAGDPHRYYCPTCDVLWITGWSMPDD
jgi:hypothetical protein